MKSSHYTGYDMNPVPPSQLSKSFVYKCFAHQWSNSEKRHLPKTQISRKVQFLGKSTAVQHFCSFKHLYFFPRRNKFYSSYVLSRIHRSIIFSECAGECFKMRSAIQHPDYCVMSVQNNSSTKENFVRRKFLCRNYKYDFSTYLVYFRGKNYLRILHSNRKELAFQWKKFEINAL